MRNRIKKYKLVVIRFSTVDGSLMRSMPCSHCIDLMKQIGIKTVYYSSEEATIIKENVNKMDSSKYTTFGYKYINYLLNPSRCTDTKLLQDEANKRRKIAAKKALQEKK